MSEPATTLLLLSAVYFVTSKEPATRKRDLLWAGTFLALAVSCRLGVLVVIPGFIIYQWMVWTESEEKNVSELVAGLIRPAVPVIVVLILIMVYNYIRFADPWKLDMKSLQVSLWLVCLAFFFRRENLCFYSIP